MLRPPRPTEGLKIGVNGHTDNTGDDAANMRLSEERALSVKNYLVGKGLPTERLTAKGFGETQPAADNATAAGKAANRRVAIILGE